MLLVFDDLPSETLLKIIDMYAKAWQAMDGAYFLSLEREYGIDTAIYIDKEAWRVFSPIEAKRIISEMGLAEGGGLDALATALKYRVYAALNTQRIVRKDDHTLIFTMDSCRVQVARNRKNLPDFPCKEVGIIEYEEFARAIDRRIKTRCLFCPPDEHPKDAYCQWEFTLDE
jgi:hypothetical protein